MITRATYTTVCKCSHVTSPRHKKIYKMSKTSFRTSFCLPMLFPIIDKHNYLFPIHRKHSRVQNRKFDFEKNRRPPTKKYHNSAFPTWKSPIDSSLWRKKITLHVCNTCQRCTTRVQKHFIELKKKNVENVEKCWKIDPRRSIHFRTSWRIVLIFFAKNAQRCKLARMIGLSPLSGVKKMQRAFSWGAPDLAVCIFSKRPRFSNGGTRGANSKNIPKFWHVCHFLKGHLSVRRLKSELFPHKISWFFFSTVILGFSTFSKKIFIKKKNWLKASSNIVHCGHFEPKMK